MVAAAGNVFTFIFTDIEGSSRLWERFPQSMARALARHDALLRQHAEACFGQVFKTVGDAFCIAFPEPLDALSAAHAVQKALAEEAWENIEPLRIRIGLHTGPAEMRDNDYFGPTLNRVARIMGAGHGGQVLLSHDTAELVSHRLPPGVSLRKLGAARLRNLDGVEQIFQLVIDGLLSDFPPLRSLVATPNNLPNQTSAFIGRERELADLRALCREHQMVTLTGPGGTGKTRLAIEAASALLEDFPDGAWLVELATLSDPDLLAETVVSAIGLRGNPDLPLAHTLVHFLRSREVLLVIDNCEHLLRNCARLCQMLLRQCPQLHILATSRSPLSIAGEHVRPVPTLSLPKNWGGRLPAGQNRAETYGQYEAVRLFVDRAAAALPGFALTDENADQIARLCWRLDGIPHAIELAAARVRLLSLDQILHRLNDRFRLLGGRNASALPHQQTLRTMIDWSYEMLSESEKALLARLSAFGRGRSLEAIEAVCSGDPVDEFEILDLLGALVDKSLISMETDATGEPRYYMLESLWEYAREKLKETNELDLYRDRHLRYFAEFAEMAEPHLHEKEQAKWLARLAEEHGNIRLAIDRACTAPDGGEAGLRLQVALTRYWEVRSRLHEGREHFDTLLALPAAQGRTALRGQALGGAGRLAWCCDDDLAARTFYTEAIEILRELGEEADVGLLLTFLGFVERNEGNFELAEKHFAEGYEIGNRLGHERITVVAISGRGSLAADRGDFVQARALKQEALDIFRELGDRWVFGLLSWSLARVVIAAGEFDYAATLLRDLVAVIRELGNRWIIPYAIEAFAQIALGQGQGEQAAILFGASECALKTLGLGASPTEKKGHAQNMAGLQSQLDPETLQARLAEGATLSMDEALDLALKGSEPA